MREAASEPPANLRQVAPITSIFGFDILGSPRLCENQLLRKALAERHQQLERAIEPNLPPVVVLASRPPDTAFGIALSSRDETSLRAVGTTIPLLAEATPESSG
jgi:hypothetical protein